MSYGGSREILDGSRRQNRRCDQRKTGGERVRCTGLCCIATEVFFANDAGLWAFDLLSRFVCPRPNGPFGIPPQSGESVRKPGWRLGLDERLAKIVQGHFDSLLIISSGV